MKLQFSIVWVVLVCVAVRVLASHAGLSPSIEIAIELEEEVYTVGDRVTGTVMVYNRLPAGFPVTFKVETYKDGQLRYRHMTNIAHVFPGKTEYDLGTFHLTNALIGSGARGRWMFRITREGEKDEETAAEASFYVR